jgi:hypothetical protein
MRLLERCRASERRDPVLAPGGGVPLWGWAARGAAAAATAAEREPEEQAGSEEMEGAGRDGPLGVAREEALLEAVADPAFRWSWANEARAAVDVRVSGPGASVAFQVARKRGPGGVVYEAECVEEVKEKLVISRCLARRPRKADFKFLLVHSLSALPGHVLTWAGYAAVVQDAEDGEVCALSEGPGRPRADAIGPAAGQHTYKTSQRFRW